MNQMMLALIVASNLVVIFTRAAASANRVNEVLTVESQLTDTPESAKKHLHNLVILPLTM